MINDIYFRESGEILKYTNIIIKIIKTLSVQDVNTLKLRLSFKAKSNNCLNPKIISETTLPQNKENAILIVSHHSLKWDK